VTGTVEVRDAFCLHPLPDGGAVAALRGLGLTVAPGELLVVHGPNGSGKTTLMRVLAGEQPLAAGRAIVAGLDLAAARPRDLARWRNTQLGQVDQDARRLLRNEFDVLDNVAMHLRIAGTPRGEARSTALEALEALGLGELAARRVGTLSGGQRQRVAVCAALAHRPELVLADEPTGELDEASADAVYKMLSEAVRAVGATLVLVTHDRRAGAIADRVVRIRDGRISETWNPGAETGSEQLVMDDRGWIRLPQAVRDQVPGGTLWAPAVAEGRVELRRLGPETPPALIAEAELQDHETGLAMVELRGVCLSYPGGKPVLGPGFDLTVQSGEMVVVAGRSGAGKSTLLRVALGLQRPDEGTVRLGGEDLAGLDRDARAELRGRLSAVVMQQVHLAPTLDATAGVDLARAARGLPADPELVAGLLAELGLTGLAHRRAAALSGGERQRVALARALALQPQLLVLDEPTSQLDEASAQRVAEVLGETARKGTAVLVASHDPVLTEAATRVLTP
jgi:ABC-type lipoprotein export system ATPase subunit